MRPGNQLVIDNMKVVKLSLNTRVMRSSGHSIVFTFRFITDE